LERHPVDLVPGSLALSPEGSGWKQPFAAAAQPSIDFELYCIPNRSSPRAWGRAEQERTGGPSGASAHDLQGTEPHIHR
jgi:hypothetical protein